MPSIVIAEDDPSIRDLLRQLLVLDGFKVTALSDGSSALDAVLAENPDLVVLDLMMPHMDGLSVLHALRENDATRSTPVVIVTAKIDDETTWKGWSGGCDYYLTKPFEPDDLISAVHRLLSPTGASA
ncbi:MAG: response regulator transcription factor [Actinomycetota bacterium]|nr:response regulator transcription factor [Actinomycetota bacterium]